MARSGKLTRRDFLRVAGALSGVAASGMLPALSRAPILRSVMAASGAAVVPGATPEERALNGIKALKAARRIKDGDTFVIMHHSGQRNQIVPAMEEFNKLTGLNFKNAEVGLEGDIYTKAMNEAVVRSGSYDGFLTFVNWIGDMAEAGLIVDLTDWFAQYNPEIDSGTDAYVPPLDKFTTTYKGRRFAVGADNDAFSMFYRKDMFNNPDEQKRFADKYGKKMTIPKTWDDFDQLVEFFDRPDQGIRGTHLYAERYFAYTNWAARFISKGGAYFNANMDPMIASDVGIAALERLAKVVKNRMWPDAVTGDWSVAYKRFPEGSVFSAWAWASLGKWSQDPKTSKISGKVGYMPIPGSLVDGVLYRATPHVVGWSFSASRYGKSPEAAYLFFQWFTGPTKGAQFVSRIGTLDPYRKSWFDLPGFKRAYGAEFLPVLLADAQNDFADISLRGANEYLDKLNVNLQAVFAGQKTPEQGLKTAAAEWQKITNRLGRLGQIQAWKDERKNYPQPIQRLWKRKYGL
jgi:multiple sugar transport system substrate-binding protein